MFPCLWRTACTAAVIAVIDVEFKRAISDPIKGNLSIARDCRYSDSAAVITRPCCRNLLTLSVGQGEEMEIQVRDGVNPFRQVALRIPVKPNFG